MKAIRMHEYGGPGVLHYEEAPIPVPASDEVLIRIFASGVNPVDWKIRSGAATKLFPVQLPLIPGWDVSGEVVEVGSDILNFRVGDEVYGRPDLNKNGSYAEYMVVKADQVNKKPKSIDHDKSAAVPLAGQTAWEGLFEHGDLKPGQRVLIHGGAGGVGSYAVQFAKWKGAYVITTASGKDAEFLEELGADEVIDYHNENFTSDLEKVDLVFDLIGGDTQRRSLDIIKSGGKLVTTVAPSAREEAGKRSIELTSFLTRSNPAVLQTIADLIDSGKIKPVISKIFPLEKAADAQRFGEDGHPRGKIVLKVV